MYEFWIQLESIWQALELRNLIDILIVAILVYEVLRLVRGTRAVQMAVGLLLVGFLYEMSRWFELTTVQWVLRNAVVYFGFAVIVLFQHEIRAALTHLGNNIRLPFMRKKLSANPFGQEWYDEVVLAVTTLASEKTGALMVFERDVGLKTYIESGIRLDSRVNYDLLITIFNTHTPLHDGAVIISNNKVAAACCFLPLTQNPLISRELGTRHRSAIGITEDTDAFSIIVSEETGVISFAKDGELKRHLDGTSLRTLIQREMEPWRSEKEKAEIEEEERRREREIDELVTSSKVATSRKKVQPEEVREETSV
ncbi:MAG: TIGR00159 family protein [Acidobacteriota bacterium]|nr:MAG: TIGR00159 family protein [Acidobacteriota bacterium]